MQRTADEALSKLSRIFKLTWHEQAAAPKVPHLLAHVSADFALGTSGRNTAIAVSGQVIRCNTLLHACMTASIVVIMSLIIWHHLQHVGAAVNALPQDPVLMDLKSEGPEHGRSWSAFTQGKHVIGNLAGK